MKSLYFIINFCSVIVPLIFSFHPKLQFHKHWKAFFLSNFIVGSVFVVWDAIFTSMGIWGFNEEYLLGIHLFHLPMEEILFFVCIPYACLFTYHCLNILIAINWNRRTENIFCILISLLLAFLGIVFHNLLYTSATFLSTAVFILGLQFIFKVDWFGKLLSIYPVLLLPFFIVNGILTGSGLDNPIVWYNNSENLNIRLLTIPVEDVVYGFELIMLNIAVFEYLKKSNSAKPSHHTN